MLETTPPHLDESSTRSKHRLTSVRKRNGDSVEFDPSKIEEAVAKCFIAVGESFHEETPALIAKEVTLLLEKENREVTVDDVQDKVERSLQSHDLFVQAKAYILYRAKRDEERGVEVPAVIARKFEEAKDFFQQPIQQFQFFDKYSRFSNEMGRRETWPETVDRTVSYLRELSDDKLDDSTYTRIQEFILEMKAMPSMRLLAMAGAPAQRNNICIYNCSFVGVDCLDAFVEALIISMCGCGVGFSVETHFTDELPKISKQVAAGKNNLVVGDSSEGWAEALRMGLTCWFTGSDITFDYSEIRPAGAVLKTKGGRASGPGPLKMMMNFIRERIFARQGKRLRPIDCHDIMCAIGDCAVQGGVRRTAMISLFDFDDTDMLHAKHGEFWVNNPQRQNANNSAVWPDDHMSQAEIASIMLEIDSSQRGEPGLFIRRNCRDNRPGRRADYEYFGTNPCGEIILRSCQFCNLSIGVARPEDSIEDLMEKVEVASIIGTIQSSATNFPGLRDVWSENCEEERLLGVDITGQMDRPITEEEGEILKRVSIQANKETAAKLSIQESASITCVKPSGNSSTLLDCSAGIHPRWSQYYIRNVRVAATSPIFKVLKHCGVPMDPENGQTIDNAVTWVAHFPVKSPNGATLKDDLTAHEQCEYWLTQKIHYTEHNPSVTIYYGPDEILSLMQWLYDQQDVVGGMTFLPRSDAQYQQMPYEEISEDNYIKLMDEFPEIDFSLLYKFEKEDFTTAAQELACTSGACEIT